MAAHAVWLAVDGPCPLRLGSRYESALSPKLPSARCTAHASSPRGVLNSPAIDSKRSCSVTSPCTSPYSSTTSARWLVDERKFSSSSIPVSDDISLTATLDIVRAISDGRGPRHATMLLGYAGWGPGQLEEEIAQNGWLHCAATESLIFDRSLDNKYDRALALLGINPAMLSMDAGHA